MSARDASKAPANDVRVDRLVAPPVVTALQPRPPCHRRVHSRRLQACLLVASVYLFLVGIAAAVRLEAYQWGFTLMRFAREVLVHVWVGHWVGALVVGVLSVAVGRIERVRPLAARCALAALPLMLIVSWDRLATVAYRPIRASTGLYMAHPTRGWTLRPGWTGLQEGTEIHINSRGLRGPEVSPQKEPGERRILFLGDSVTYGYGVPEGTSFVSRFGEQCIGAATAARRLTAINLAVPAYSTWQEYDLLVHEGLWYHPDVIVLVFCLNDVLEKFQLVQFGGHTRGFEPARPSVLEWSGLVRAARAWRKHRQRMAKETARVLGFSTSVRYLLSDPHAPLVEKGWRITQDYLNRIVEAARRASIPLVVVSAPHRDQFVSDEPAPRPTPQDVLAELTAARGVPFLDLLPLFRGHLASADVEVSSLFVDAFHFTAAGHELAGREICAFLSDQDLLD